jgi:siderophore synthetase component
MSSPQEAVAQLRPDAWIAANTRLVVKAIAEFSHELLIRPVLLRVDEGWGHYQLDTDLPDVEYRFRARIFSLDHWHIDARSLRKVDGGKEAALDAISLIIELRERLAIPARVLPGYLEEIANTLCASAYKWARAGLRAVELARAGFQEVETAMTEGHPIFVANNARLGFSAPDYRSYAPEAAEPVALIWLAACKRRADFACVDGLSYDELLRQELGDRMLDAFTSALRRRGVDPSSYVLIPVHPWQWENRIAQLFAADLANGDLIYLGRGEDRYLAQQSIRTFYNISNSQRRYVKTALSIVNMGFTRGLSSSMATSAAAVNEWVANVVGNDDYLRQCRFTLLREVAFVGLRHPYYEKASKKRSDPYKEMLAALWRDNPHAGIEPGERLMTMAALMHLDGEGASLLAEIIRSSGVQTEVWVREYLRCYLKPLLHCFYAHNLVFTPHCENVILVLKNQLPVRAIIKDIAEDVGVLNPAEELPERVRRLALRVPEDVMTLSIFTDAFDCVFRFLAEVLSNHAQYPEREFWRLVAACIHEYEKSQPQLAERFRRYDLFAPTFARNCLNRLQLRDHRMMVDLNAAEPVDSLQFAGTLDNPIASFSERHASRN